MGTGKTGTMIYILREEYSRHGAIQPTLIFAPLSVCPQWKKEFTKFSKIDPKHIHVLTGPGKKRTEMMGLIMARAQHFGEHPIIITNYESVQMEGFYKCLLAWNPKIIVFDESDRLKDSSGTRAKAVYPLALAADRRFLLTGTPITEDMLNIFGQYKAMDPSIFGGNFFKFKNTYFYDANAGMPKHVHFPNWQPKPEAAKLLGKIIGATSVQATKAECLDLPPLLTVPVPVELSPEQRRAYESMKKAFVAELDGKVAIAEFAMTKTLRLQQILAGYITPENSDTPTWVKSNPRLDALHDLLEAVGREKTIIWTNFVATYSKIGEVAEALGRKVVYLTGEQSAAQKQAAIDEFCRGDADTFVSNPAAGGVGINLVEAKVAVYYQRGYSLTQYLQSQARNFRGGSEMHDKITHYILQAEGTLDEVIGTALDKKLNVAEAILAWAKNIS